VHSFRTLLEDLEIMRIANPLLKNKWTNLWCCDR
jgi:hypothetical protein